MGANDFSAGQIWGTPVGFTPARDGGMWLLLGNELRRLRRGTEVARVASGGAPRGGVWSLSEDSQGNVWIATFDQGVCQGELQKPGHDGVVARWGGQRRI